MIFCLKLYLVRNTLKPNRHCEPKAWQSRPLVMIGVIGFIGLIVQNKVLMVLGNYGFYCIKELAL